MLCDRCGQREATIHEVLIKGGEKLEQHLCENCAGEAGIQAQPHAPINELLSKYVLAKTAQAAERAESQAAPSCSSCGLTFSDFKRSGLLGCARCYREFEEQLGPLLCRAHDGGTHHVGKIPKRALEVTRSGGGRERIEALLGSVEERAERVMALRKQLADAVAAEQYERAAQLRDELHHVADSTTDDTAAAPEPE